MDLFAKNSHIHLNFVFGEGIWQQLSLFWPCQFVSAVFFDIFDTLENVHLQEENELYSRRPYSVLGSSLFYKVMVCVHVLVCLSFWCDWVVGW